MLYLVCQILYVSNQVIVCPFLTQPGALDAWVDFLKAVLDRPLPHPLEQTDDNVLTLGHKDKTLQWKLKAVAAKLSYRLLLTTGKVYKAGHIPTNDTEAFSYNFVEQLAPILMESHLGLMFKKKTHFFVGSKALQFSIKFIQLAVKL